MDSLICTECRATYALDEARWRCECGGMLDIQFEPVFDLARIEQRPPTLWKYREAIPIHDDSNIVSFGEGFTPLLEVNFDGRSVWVKQEYLFPTGSFKDRGATVLVSKVKELGVRHVVEDSSGNAGCAIAAYCARANIACDVYVPEATVTAKLAQVQLYGAHLRRVPGSREDTAAAALAAAEKHYYASHVWNPFFLQGTKTFAFEVCEQLGWRAPDVVVVAVGHGSLLLGLHTGFKELQNAGIIGRIPRIVGVQAANCAPLYKAFAENLNVIPRIARRATIAEGVSIAEPYRGKQILEAVRQSGGTIIAVDEAEIEDSLKQAGQKGFYIEPTSAVATAGLRRYLQQHEPSGTVVSVFTGHGLKATEKILQLLKS